jgi:hypothetical protein
MSRGRYNCRVYTRGWQESVPPRPSRAYVRMRRVREEGRKAREGLPAKLATIIIYVSPRKGDLNCNYCRPFTHFHPLSPNLEIKDKGQFGDFKGAPAAADLICVLFLAIYSVDRRTLDLTRLPDSTFVLSNASFECFVIVVPRSSKQHSPFCKLLPGFDFTDK